MSGNLLLEAAGGTIREVDVRGKAPEYPRLKVLMKRDCRLAAKKRDTEDE